MSNTEKKEGIEKIYTKKGAASVFEVSTDTVDRLRKTGKLKSFLVGGQVRFKESSLIKLIDEAE